MRRVLPVQSPVIFGSKVDYKELIKSMSPLAYWPLDDETGTTAVDATGNGYNGTYNNVTLKDATGPGGKFVPYFNGSSAHVSLPVGVLAVCSHAEFSMSAWAKADFLWTDGFYREVHGFFVSNSNRCYCLKNGPVANNFQNIYNGNNSNNKINNYADFSPTTWFHFVVTVSVANNIINSYMNSVKHTVPPVGIFAWVGTPTAYNIGADQVPSSRWKGWICDSTLWNRVLTDSEVAQLYYGA